MGSIGENEDKRPSTLGVGKRDQGLKGPGFAFGKETKVWGNLRGPRVCILMWLQGQGRERGGELGWDGVHRLRPSRVELRLAQDAACWGRTL